MPFVAILLDVIAVASYVVQSQQPRFYTLGMILQAILTVVLLIMTFAYRGKKFGWFNFSTWVHNFSLRYALIVVSFLGNVIVLFLYYLNLTGRNSLIFS